MRARLVFVCFVVCRRPPTLPWQPWRTLGCACDAEHHGRDAAARLNEWATCLCELQQCPCLLGGRLVAVGVVWASSGRGAREWGRGSKCQAHGGGNNFNNPFGGISIKERVATAYIPTVQSILTLVWTLVWTLVGTLVWTLVWTIVLTFVRTSTWTLVLTDVGNLVLTLAWTLVWTLLWTSRLTVVWTLVWTLVMTLVGTLVRTSVWTLLLS